MKWVAFDPSWLVALAATQAPDREWLPAALAACTRCQWESRRYAFFLVDERAWQFEGNLHLHDPKEGHIVLDVLTGHRVGGIEFLGR